MAYRALVVGCGNIGLRYDLGARDPANPQTHAYAFGQHHDFTLAGLCEPDAARRADAAAAFPDVPCFGDVETAMAQVRPDVAAIATPSAQRIAPIAAALAADVGAILCEKPLALSENEAQDVVARCRAAGAALVVNYSRRFDPAYGEVGRRIAGFGALRAGSGRYVRGLANNGAHLLDLLDWWFGPMTLVETTKSGEAASPHLRLRASDGGEIMLQAVTGPGYDVFELDLFFAQAAVRLSDHGRRLTVERTETLRLGAESFAVLGAPQAIATDPGGSMLRGLDHLSDLMRAPPGERDQMQLPALESALRTTRLFAQALA